MSGDSPYPERALFLDAGDPYAGEGDPIPWIEMFLTAVKTQAGDAVQRAELILDLREDYLAAASAMGQRRYVARKLLAAVTEGTAGGA